MTVGLIINAKSNRSAATAETLLAVARRYPEVRAEVLDGVFGLADAFADLNAHKADTIILAGGDGTIQAALTDAINNNRFEHTPHYALLPCGMTNVIAHDCGLAGKPSESLEKFLKRRRSGDLSHARRSLLTVSPEGEAPVHGFFLGAGGFHSAVEFSRERVQSKGAKRTLALVASVFSYMVKVAKDPKGTIEPIDFEIDVPGGPAFAGMPRTVLMTTTLTKLGAGMFPFWGEGAGAMATTMIDYPIRKMFAAAPAAMRSRSMPWFEEAGYRSWRSDAMNMRFDGPFVFDGEMFTAERTKPIMLGTAHVVDFLN